MVSLLRKTHTKWKYRIVRGDKEIIYIAFESKDNKNGNISLATDDIFHIDRVYYSESDGSNEVSIDYNKREEIITEELRDSDEKIVTTYDRYGNMTGSAYNNKETGYQRIVRYKNGEIYNRDTRFGYSNHTVSESFENGKPVFTEISYKGNTLQIHFDENGEIYQRNKNADNGWGRVSMGEFRYNEDGTKIRQIQSMSDYSEVHAEYDVNGKLEKMYYMNGETGEVMELPVSEIINRNPDFEGYVDDGGVQFSIVAPKEILDFGVYNNESERTSDILVAEAMERAGEDAGTIQTATGLVRGADNVWYDSAVDEEQAEEIAEKYAENLHMSEKNSNFANNTEYEREQDEVSKWLSRDANGAVQARSLQSADGELLMEQSRSDRGSIEGDRTGREDGNSRELGIPDELRRGLVNPLTAVNDAIEKRLSDFGIKHTSKRAVQVDAKTFHDAISEYKRQDKPMKWCVDVHDVNGDAENHPYVDCICLLLEDGKAGIAVTSEGDIISVFSNSTERNVLDKLLPMALAVGGKKADFYTTRTQSGLQNLYARYGLVVTGQTPFNTDYMIDNPDWDGDANHTVGAGVFTLPVEKAIQFKAEHQELIVDLDNVPMFDDLENGYGQMMDDRDSQLEALIESEEAQLSVVNPRVVTSPAQVSEETVKRMSQHAAEKMAVVDDPVAPLWEKTKGAYNKLVQDCLDNTEAVRGFENWLNEQRRLHGTTPSERKPISAQQSVRNALDALDSAIAGTIAEFENTKQKDLFNFLDRFSRVVEKSAMYKKYKKDALQKGEKTENELTPLDFIERYLITRSNAEQFEIDATKTRGEGAFAKRADRGDGEVIDMATFANEFLAEFGEQTVNRLWEKIRACTDYSLQMLLDSGVIDKDFYDECMERDYYIPQKGYAEKDMHPEIYISKDSGRYKLDKPSAIANKREGGESLAGHVLSYVIYDVQNSIRTAKENEVRMKMYNMLIQNEQYLTPYGINRPARVYIVKKRDEKTGEFIKDDKGSYILEEVATLSQEDENDYLVAKASIKSLREEKQYTTDPIRKKEIQKEINALKDAMYVYSTRSTRDTLRTKAELNQTKVSVWRDGELYQMDLRGMADVANALNGVRMTKGEFDGWIKSTCGVIASLCTTYNPAFWSVNLVRDIPFVVTKGTIEYGGMFQLYFGREFLPAMGTRHAINKWIWTGKFDMSSENGRMMHDFITHGGITGYNHVDDVQKLKDRMEQMMNHNFMLKPFHWLGQIAKNLNEYSEMITRFAAYKAVLKMGYSEAEAIKAAKNLSVNFNRHGQGQEFLNTFNNLSMFTNAAIQGASGFYRSFSAKEGENKVWRVTKASMLWIFIPAFLGFMATILTMDSDDDEKEIDDFFRDNYICFGNLGTIALNEQIKPFWNIGVNIALAMNGKREKGKVADSVISSFLTNLVPLPPALTKIGVGISNKYFGEQDLTAADIIQRTVTPQALATVNNLANNKDFLGNDMFKDYVGDVPQYRLSDREAILYRDLAAGMYVITGGNMSVPSTHRKDNLTKKVGLDINPKEIKAILSWIPNGWMDALCFSYGFVKSKFPEDKQWLVKDEDNYVRIKDIPIVNKFYRPSDDTKQLYRYNIFKKASAVVREYDETNKNLYAQAEGGNVDAATMILQLNNDYMEEGYNIEIMRKFLEMYKLSSWYKIAKSFNMTEKEFKKRFKIPEDTNMDDVQKLSAKGLRLCLYQYFGTEKAVDIDADFMKPKKK